MARLGGPAALSYIIGIAVLALILYRQLSVRRVRESYRLVIILAVIGVLELSRFTGSQTGSHVDGGRIALALVGSAVLAVGTGVLRAMTVRLWRGGDGRLLRQGTWLTATLWVVAVAAHLALDALVAGGTGGKKGDIGNATIALYLAVSFGVQQMVMRKRAERAQTDVQTPADPASVNGQGTHVS
jgi:hypothetical protein